MQVTSNFSFLRGASHPDELVLTAARLGHAAIAITDRNSLAGIVRAHHAAKTVGIRLVVGVRLDLRDGASLLAYPRDRAAYGRLTRLLTLGKRRAPKGECRLDYADVLAHGEGQIVIILPPEHARDTAPSSPPGSRPISPAAPILPPTIFIAAMTQAVSPSLRPLPKTAGCRSSPLTTCSITRPSGGRCRMSLTCIREHCTIHEAGFRLAANAERHLKPPAEMARLFRGYEDAVARAA